MWGLGGLTFGLTMRYLGISLGMAVALGLTTIIGTMGPPIFRGALGELGVSASGRINEHAIFTLIAVIGAARAFEMPTQQTLLPSLVPSRLLSRAVAANATAGQTAIVLGPALGGLLYIAGPATVYSLCAVLFLVASGLSASLRIERRPPQREPATLATLFAGVAFIRRHHALLGAISLDLFAVLLGGAAALFPVYARDILHTGPWGLGLLRSAPAIGALIRCSGAPGR